MNDKGREELVKAAMAGVPQITRAFKIGDGLCALGVLAQAIGIPLKEGQDSFNSTEWLYLSEVYGLRFLGVGQIERLTCELCGERRIKEADLIAHYNDHHDMDFLTIARKM